MAIACVNGVNLYYEVHGDGEPLFLIPGFTADHTCWTGMLDALAQHFQVVLFDNRGVGRSDQPDVAYTIEDMAADVIALADHLGCDRAHFAGQSMGGAIAQMIGYRYPERVHKLVLCDTFEKISHTSLMAFYTALTLLQHGLPRWEATKAILPWAFRSDFLADPDNMALLKQLDDANEYPQTETGFRRQLEALEGFCSSDWVSQLSMPALMFCADEDIITLQKDMLAMAGKIPNVTVVTVDNGGHAGPVEHPHLYAKSMLEFL